VRDSCAGLAATAERSAGASVQLLRSTLRTDYFRGPGDVPRVKERSTSPSNISGATYVETEEEFVIAPSMAL
jgi:hypothetical protein